MGIGEGENFIVYVDEVSDVITYVGKAPRGSTDSMPVWQIKKIETIGAITKVLWAEGDDGFKRTWNDRLSYTYK